MTILLGIAGGIAAYKAAELVRLLRQQDHRVRVVMTRAAQAFVTPLTLATLSGEPAHTDLFDQPAEPGATGAAIEHIELAQSADVVVIAPATAHLLARMAHGLADDLLTTVLLATPAPVIVAPAMNVLMWQHPATRANLELLRQRGVIEVAPAAGYLACGMVGEGRMAELEAIADAIAAAAPGGPRAPVRLAAPAASGDLAGETVLITAGPTREPLDPVRYLSNRSSGRMGYALAAAARRRGARVILVSGPTALAAPEGVELVPVATAEEMAAAAEASFPSATIAVLAAAVADYRPAHPSREKIKKGAPGMRLELTPTPDILARLGRRRRHQVLVGFAAETDAATATAAARAKLTAKNADLMVLNLVGRPGTGFDAEDNAVTLITANQERALERAPKSQIAERILDAVRQLPRHAVSA